MSKNQTILHRKKLVIAMSLAIVGGAMSGCSSSSDSSEGAGSFTIQASGGIGGDATFARGGDGGELYVYNNGGSGGVEISKSGSANATITSPEIPTTPVLGSNPLQITTDTAIDMPVLYTVLVDGAVANLAIGELYVDENSILRSSTDGGDAVYATDTPVADSNLFYRSNVLQNELYQAIGDDDVTPDLAPAGMAYFRDNDSIEIYLTDGDNTVNDTRITGLSVAAGSTLTLGSTSGCNTSFRVNDDIDNSGRILKTEAGGCSLRLNSNHYFATGDVVNAGNADADDGGSLIISASRGIKNSGTMDVSGFDTASDSSDRGGDAGAISLSANSFIINSGELNASGGDAGDNGGDGGELSIGEPSYLENSGIIDVSGGANIGAGIEGVPRGGQGGNASLEADAVLNNTKNATINASGGNGESGGEAGRVSLNQNNSEGAILNAGNITVNGGAASVTSAGNAGNINMNTGGGQIQNTADLSATGGDIATGGDEGNTAGDGGRINLYTNYGNTETGEIVISGNLNVNGGNAPVTGNGSGGDAGQIQVSNDANNYLTDARIALLGYSVIDANGGDGLQGGNAAGNGDGIDIGAGDNEGDDNGVYVAGSVTNYVPMNARGGNSTATGEAVGNGGSGGQVDLYTSGSDNVSELNVTVTNTANIDVSSGSSVGTTVADEEALERISIKARKIRGSSVDMYGFHGVENSGSLTLNAGTGGPNRNTGGRANIDSEVGAVTNSGAISANGAEGGDGGYIDLSGNDINNSAALSVNGGDAIDNAASTGGDGGSIGLFTHLLSNPQNSGSFSYTFGTGEEGNGVEGCATVNFVKEGNCEDFFSEK